MSFQLEQLEHDDRWAAVDKYALSHLHTPRHAPALAALEAAQKNAKEQGLPDIAVSPAQGKYLQLQARLIHAKNILEIGTLGGYSTIWLAAASPDVRVTSIEVDPHHAEVARANIANAGVSERVDVRLGPGIEVLPKLVEEVKSGKRDRFQLVFIDADKENNWNYVDIAIGICDPGACIIVDNVVRQGGLANASDNPRITGARRVVENVGKDERLEGVVVQTVSDKSYDGFLFAVVK